MRKRCYHAGMVTITIKLPAEIKQRLAREAQNAGTSVSAIIREAVAARLKADVATGSLYERTQDLCGAGGSGRRDLATRRDALRGFGE